MIKFNSNSAPPPKKKKMYEDTSNGENLKEFLMLIFNVAYFHKLPTVVLQTLFESVVMAFENGGKRVPVQTTLGYSKEQADAIQKLRNAKNDYERLGLPPGATKYVNE